MCVCIQVQMSVLITAISDVISLPIAVVKECDIICMLVVLIELDSNVCWSALSAAMRSPFECLHHHYASARRSARLISLPTFANFSHLACEWAITVT